MIPKAVKNYKPLQLLEINRGPNKTNLPSKCFTVRDLLKKGHDYYRTFPYWIIIPKTFFKMSDQDLRHGPLIDMLLSTDLFFLGQRTCNFVGVLYSCSIWVDHRFYWEILNLCMLYLSEVKFRVQIQIKLCWRPWSKQKWYTVVKIL